MHYKIKILIARKKKVFQIGIQLYTEHEQRKFPVSETFNNIGNMYQ